MKNLLFIILSQDYNEEMFLYFENFLFQHSINLHIAEVKDDFTIEDAFNALYVKQDYVYFFGHADLKGVGDDENQIIYDWEYISEMACLHGYFNDSCSLLLHCCLGGNKEVTEQINKSCSKFTNIVGTIKEHNDADLILIFSNFIYAVEKLKQSPNIACKNISSFLNIDLNCWSI